MKISNGNTNDLTGKVAIITGGSMGIGLACAEELSKNGVKIVIGDINEVKGRNAIKQLNKKSESYFENVDVAKTEDVKKLIDFTLSKFKKINILINNAAKAIGGVIDNIEEDTWNEVINTNLTSVWRTMRYCVPVMRKQKSGSIINISSVQSICGFQGWAAYATAKGGINSLTQQTAVDLAPFGIRVNAILPGTIMTPLNKKIFKESKDPKGLIDSWNKAHPLGRFGEAKEVANLVTFLASEKSSFMTGDLIRIDGGLSIKGA